MGKWKIIVTLRLSGMDNSGFLSLNFSMNVANSQAQSSQILQQLPGFQQLFTQNAPVKPTGSNQNVIQQAVLPINNTQQTGNPTVMATQTGLQFVGQPTSGFLGQQQQQQFLAQHPAAQQMLGPRGIYTTNYHLMPRNYTFVNQGVQGTGVAVQLSPQQIGTNLNATTLSPLEQQQQFLQSAGFDPQLAALHQNQQQIAFQNANGQLMIQSPTQQLMLQSPNQQFTIQGQNQFAVQSPSIAQFTPQQLSNAPGSNVLVQGQNGGMILQSDNFVTQGLGQNVFMPNHGIIQNVNQQMYGNAHNILANQMPGVLSHSQLITNQNIGTLSVNQSPTGNESSDNLSKANSQSSSSGIANQQMQLLAQIANQGSSELSQSWQNQINMASSSNPNQSLPSFGHFLLHHHMQSLPHPFLQNLGINSAASHQAEITNAAVGQNVTRNLNGASSQTASLIANQCVPNLSSNDNSMHMNTVSDNNINAEFNNWNIEQFSNQSRIVNNMSSTEIQSYQTKPRKGEELKTGDHKLCSQKPSSTITTSNTVSTCVVTTMYNVLSQATLPLNVCTNDIKGKISEVDASVSNVTKQKISQDLKPQADLSDSNNLDNFGGSEPNTILVPYGWVRALEDDCIVYYSPTCTRLTSTESVRQYLVSDGTCKCGLECPLHIEKVFNFSREAISIKWTPSSIKDTGNLCNHKRKYSAVTQSQTSRSGLAFRPDVSLVSSSAMMSPRVSSTVQDSFVLYKSNKKHKVGNGNNDLKTEVIDSDFNKKLKSVHSHEISNHPDDWGDDITDTLYDNDLNDNKMKHMLSDNIVSTSSVDTPELSKDTDESGTTDILLVNYKEPSEKVIEDDHESNIKDRKHNISLKKTNESLSIIIPKQPLVQKEKIAYNIEKKEDTSINFNVSRNIKGKIRVTERMKTEIKTSSDSAYYLDSTHQITQSAKSPVYLKSNSDKKSKSHVGSRTRSSANSRQMSDNSSTGSERKNVSQFFERSLSPTTDHDSSADIFTHFMNFCGMNPSNLPPVFQQNFVRVPSSSLPSKSPIFQESIPQVYTSRKDRMKLPVMPPNPLSPFQASVLANLHKLSNPPNQQVFPPFNLPGLPGNLPSGYQHGAKVKSKGSSQQTKNVQPFSHSQGPGFPFSTVFTSLGGTHPQMSNFIWLSPDSKSKSKKGRHKKVDCEKVEDIFESYAPPPNVDVSQLKDKGHGPIPKQKIASFFEKPKEFLKQQTDLLNNSISSSCSSPVLESKTSAEQNDCEKIRSDSACSDRLNSPFRLEKEVCDEDITKTMKLTENYIESSKISSKCIVSTSKNAVTSTAQGLNVSTDCTGSKGLAVIPSAPVASAPPTPTTVVHHTPGSLSCHQLSLIKARQHALDKGGKQDISKENLLNPIAAILNDPAIGQVFQQMFPEAVQEALIQSLDLQSTDYPARSHSHIQSHLAALSSPQLSITRNQTTTSSSLSQTSVGLMPVTVQKPCFPIQALLSNLSQGEFPASSLLSAAAKAQLAQQNHLSMLMAHHLGPLSGNMVPLQNLTVCTSGCSHPNSIHTASESAEESHAMAMPVSSPVEKACVSKMATNLVAPVTSTDKPKPKPGAPKISELLSRNVAYKESENQEMLNLIQQLQQHGTSVNLSYVSVPEMVKLAQGPPPILPLNCLTNQRLTTENTHRTTLGARPGNVLSSSLPPLLDAHFLQMYSALGIPSQNVSHPKQQLGGSDACLHAPDTCVDTSTSNVTLNQQQLVNTQLQPTSQSISSMPLYLRQREHDNINLSIAQNFVPLLGNSHGSTSMINLQDFQSPYINELIQQQLSLGQTNSSIQDNNIHLQQLASNQSVNIPNAVADIAENPLLIGNPMAMNSNTQAVMNMLNMQQSIGTGTNLTTMQLQTLQLQQQLLQQLQQVQGMQTLISQYNLQNIAYNNTTMERRQTYHDTSDAVGKDNVVAERAKAGSASHAVAAVMPNVEVCVSSSAQVSNGSVESCEKKEVTLKRSNTIRVIAAADTTDDCSSTRKTVDIGTETDAIEDNSEMQLESEEKHDENRRNDPFSDTDSDNGDAVVFKGVSNILSPPGSLSISRTSQLNTCLAIATQKGTTRSSELESRLFGEKSSLAKSQNLSAELTKPTGNELKLKIKRKRMFECPIEKVSETTKKMKAKEKKMEQFNFEKKELRSSTLAATKASSSLAAVVSKGKDAGKMKEMHLDLNAEIKQVPHDDDPKASCSNKDILIGKEIQNTTQDSSECLECDSSVYPANCSQSLVLGNNSSESVNKNNLTSCIAAALSSQKGQWQLSCLKRNSSQIHRDPKDTRASRHSNTKCNKTEVGQEQAEIIALKMEVEENSDGSLEKHSILPRSFSPGDLVWGQIRGFPSWPGKLVDNTEFKRGENIEGKVFVKWFGDNTVTQVEPNKLKTLSEGLEAHHKARKKHRRGRKMNSNLEQAIQQAMAELDKKTTAVECKEICKCDKMRRVKVKSKK